MWTDSHAHLDKLSGGAAAALREAAKASVHRVITIGTEPKDWPEVIRLSEAFGSKSSAAEGPASNHREALNTSSQGLDQGLDKSQPLAEVCGALGMHPHTAAEYNDESERFLKQNLHRDSIVALGEIGLDYHYENSAKTIQREVFERQLNLAREFGLPVEVHTRDAEEDTLFFLKKFKGGVRGLLHCFTGSYSMAKAALDLGFNISFSGIITFKKTEALRETCRKIPPDRLHIETDSPFLAPAPNRGKPNRPAWAALVAKAAAGLHALDEESLSRQLEKNTLDLFPKIRSRQSQPRPAKKALFRRV